MGWRNIINEKSRAYTARLFILNPMNEITPVKSITKYTLNIFKSEIGIPTKVSYNANILVITIACNDNLYR